MGAALFQSYNKYSVTEYYNRNANQPARKALQVSYYNNIFFFFHYIQKN